MIKTSRISLETFRFPSLKILLCSALGMGSAYSQGAVALSEEGIPTEQTVEAEKPEAEDALAKLETPTEPIDAMGSRFAGSDIEAYIAVRAAKFSMNDREVDPFGLNQDPNRKPERKLIPSRLPARRTAALPPTPLRDIVNRIPVTTIMPSDKKFLVRSRTFTEGDEFPLIYQGKRLSMKITKVTGHQIHFRNQQNGETAVYKMQMLPPGMTSGSERSRPPGMVQDGRNAPLDLSNDN